MSQVKRQIKEVDLLGFQKKLNSQFLEIFENKKLNIDSDAESRLGFCENIGGLRFFFNLSSLKQISSDNKFEPVFFSKPWVIGFNQVRGEVFTVVDFKEIINLILDHRVNDISLVSDEVASASLLYLKNPGDSGLALMFNSLALTYISNFKPILKYSEKDDGSIYWDNLIGGKLSDFFKEQSALDAAMLFDKLSNIKGFYSGMDPLQVEGLREHSNKMINLFVSLVGDVFWDSDSKSIVYEINVKRLSQFLSINI